MNYSPAKKILYPTCVAALLWYFWLPFLLAYVNDLVNGPARSMIDDSFMFLRYAKIWAAGHGVAWNMDQSPVYGLTSQLHFLLVIFLNTFTSLSDERIVLFSSAIPGLLLVFYLPLVCAKHALLFSRKSLGWRYVFWFATAGSIFIYFSQVEFHSRMGMETCLSTLLHAGLIDMVLTYGKNPVYRNKILIVVVAAALFLTRIDNIIVAFLFPIAYLFFVEKKPKDALHVGLAISVFILVFELFCEWYYGDFFPLSFYSKQAGYFRGFVGAVEHNVLYTLSYFLYGIFPFVVLIVIFYKNKNALPIAIFLLPALVTISYYFTMLTIMNLGSRYCFPFTVYFVIAGCIYISQEAMKDYLRILLASLSLAVMYVGIMMLDKYHEEVAAYFTKPTGFCSTGDMMDLDPGTPDLPYIKGFQTLVRFADMLNELPEGTKIVMTEFGYVGARNPRIHIIDVVGLHDRYVAHHGFSAQWLFEQKPDAIWVPHQDYTCMNHDILLSREFKTQYEYYPGLFNWGYALRKDSPNYPLMKQKLQKTFDSMYPGFVLEKYQKHYLP